MIQLIDIRHNDELFKIMSIRIFDDWSGYDGVDDQ